MIHTTCLLFSGVEILIAGMELQKMQRTLDSHYWILDDQWPLDREQNLRLLEQVKKRHENSVTILTSPSNLGFHHAFNYLTSQMPLNAGDYILTVAPDTVPLHKGYDEAMKKVLDDCPGISFIGTSSYATKGTAGRRWAHHTANNIRFEVADGPCMSHATMWRWDFLKKVGGFAEPCAYYGHIESTMWQKSIEAGLFPAYLTDYSEDFRLEGYHNDIYRRWKIAHAHEFSFKGSFKEYLEAGFK